MGCQLPLTRLARSSSVNWCLDGARMVPIRCFWHFEHLIAFQIPSVPMRCLQGALTVLIRCLQGAHSGAFQVLVRRANQFRETSPVWKAHQTGRRTILGLQ